jgi:hypothetical protein
VTSRSPILEFFFCAYAFSWLCWLSVVAASLGFIDLALPQQFLITLGQFGPFLAAILLTTLQAGKPGLRELVHRLLRWKVNPVWFGVAFLLPPFSYFIAIGAHSVVQGVPPEFKPVSIMNDVFINYFIILFVGGPLGEELGWRGFALPALQASHCRVTASVILGIAWAGWHLPLWLLADAFTVPAFTLYIVGTIPLTILFTWVYNETRASVLLAMLFHCSINTFYIILPIEPAFRAWVVLLCASALLIIASKPKKWFSRRLSAEPLKNATPEAV